MMNNENRPAGTALTTKEVEEVTIVVIENLIKTKNITMNELGIERVI